MLDGEGSVFPFYTDFPFLDFESLLKARTARLCCFLLDKSVWIAIRPGVGRAFGLLVSTTDKGCNRARI